nr:transcription initiation factor TFIID subunit 5 [Kwoniella mangroviensis CBS 8507]OCF65260.1 transcription initiation factor TFIID subunit 5 [Kwoniella mangroviensis CBS 8507]
MAETSAPVAGPSNTSNPITRTDANLLNQFVIEYLQSHGFDKALALFEQGIAEQGGNKNKDNASKDSEEKGGKEAVFRAPGPVPLESNVKRNIPQAQAVSASTLSLHITPEFEAQAKYIIEQLQAKVQATNANADQDGADDQNKELKDQAANQVSLLDPSDRVEGYKSFRRWVDGGLDLWKPELDNLSFPLFVHTFLELVNFGFLKTARDFFEGRSTHHRPFHPQDISTLSSISTKEHVKANSFCQRMLTDKYVIPLSRNASDLLIQWLSGAGLDEDWEAGLHSAAGRAKEAIKGIVFSRISITVTSNSVPLDKITIATRSGLIASALPSAMPIDAFNTATNLKLGPPPMTEKLKEQVARTLQDEEPSQQQPNGGASPGNQLSSSLPNGHPNGTTNGVDANGDVDMTSPAGPSGDTQETRENTSTPAPVTVNVQELKIESELEKDKDPSLLSPEENETLPPIPAVFRIPDLKREVEAIRDKRKMIRLGPQQNGDVKPGSSSNTVLPSVVAFTLFDHGESASSVEFSRDSSLMAVGSSESCIRLWSLKGEKLKKKSIGALQTPLGISVSGNKLMHLYVADPSDGSLIEDEGQPFRKLIGHSGPVYSLSFDPLYGSAASPSTLLSSSQDGTVRLWSMDTYSNLVVYRGHGKDPVWDVEWGPMGVYFATASRDRTARLWSSDRVTPLRMYTGHLSDVNCVRFHPNSLYLATGSNDSSCRLWDVQRGACVRLFMGHTDAITTMAISPDGKLLASGGLDSSIWLWDLGSSRPIKRMYGHKSTIQSLSFSSDSAVLVSGGLDSTVRCWDVKSSGGEKASVNEPTLRNGAGTGADDLQGSLPMGPGRGNWEDGPHTTDLLATWPTKRTPILRTHYTPRNLCMVAGSFVPPSNASKGPQ